MIVQFYKNNSDNNVLNKNITLVKEIDCICKNSETSRVNTQLLVSVINIRGLESNYIYIPFFNRYYFIDDIIHLTNNMVKLNISTDYLMTFKNEILESIGTVKESIDSTNNYTGDRIRTTPILKQKVLDFPNKTAFSDKDVVYMVVAN